MNEILREEYHYSRKEHICFWCGDKINIGLLYHKSVQICEGGFFEIKSHKCCDHLFKILWRKYNIGDGWSSSDFEEAVREDVNETYYEKREFKDILKYGKQKYDIKLSL